MDGLTAAQIQASTQSVLQADSEVTAFVSSGRIYDSQMIPESDDSPFVAIWVNGERERPLTAGTPGLGVFAVDTDLVVDFEAPEVNGDLETVLRQGDVIKRVLLASSSWMAQWNAGLPDIAMQRWRTSDGAKLYGTTSIMFTVRHLRVY